MLHLIKKISLTITILNHNNLEILKYFSIPSIEQVLLESLHCRSVEDTSQRKCNTFEISKTFKWISFSRCFYSMAEFLAEEVEEMQFIIWFWIFYKVLERSFLTAGIYL